MPGNKSVFSDALKKASNAAWDRRWETAIREYRRAIAEFAADPVARSGLALALQEANRLDDALAEYQALARAQPDDPIPLARCAVLLERMGQRDEALAAFMQLGEMYRAQRQMNKAVEAWRQAGAMAPEHAAPHEKLAEAFTEAGHSSAAVREWLILAKAAQRAGDAARAQACVEAALKLEPDNSQVKIMLTELIGAQALHRQSEANSVELARRSALSRLAASVLDEKPQWRRDGDAVRVSDADTLLARAIDSQARGQTREAIELYEQVLASGLARSDVRFNLAVLYQSALRYDEAIKLFREAALDEQYAVPSHLALGQAMRAQGKTDAALDHYIQAMKIVDLSTVNRNQADQVIRLYQSLSDTFRAKGDPVSAEKFGATLLEFLNGKGWQDKVREVRRHIETAANDGTPVSMAEVFEAPEAPRVIELLSASKALLKQGKHYASSELASQAIELAPYYLPAHVQLAEIAVAAGRVGEAEEKYDRLAESAEVRHDLAKAVSFYRQALKLRPDVTRRSKLINVLVQSGQVPEALAEFAQVGQALQEQGHAQKALDKYQEALALARRVGVVGSALVPIRTRLAAAFAALESWDKAIAAFQELERDDPENDELQFQLIELYLRSGRTSSAEQALDKLQGRRAGSPDRVLGVLTRLADCQPEQVMIHRRLAKQLAQTGQLEKAVTVLDTLGDRLLSGSQVDQAALVIQEIIDLDPPQVDDYKHLLQELKRQVA